MIVALKVNSRASTNSDRRIAEIPWIVKRNRSQQIQALGDAHEVDIVTLIFISERGEYSLVIEHHAESTRLVAFKES